MSMDAKSGIKEITVEAVLIRADGTRIDLGKIATLPKQTVFRRMKQWLTQYM